MTHRGCKAALIALGLLLGAVALPAAAEPPTTSETRSVEVYPAGDKFVVAVYRPDGGVVLSLVTAPGLKQPPHAAPDMAELIKRGRVVYTARLAPAEAAPSDLAAQLKPPTARGAAPHRLDKRHARLARQRWADLKKRVAAAVSAMTRFGQVLNAQVKSDSPAPLPAAAPAADLAN